MVRPQEAFNDTVKALLPHLNTEKARRTALQQAFHGDSKLTGLGASGDAHSAVVHLLTRIAQNGKLSDGELAIVVFLQAVKASAGGVEVQDEITKLQDDWKHGRAKAPPPKRYGALLSFHSQDRAAVEQLGERLKREELNVYMDEWELAPGRPFPPELAEVLQESRTCVVFLGSGGLGPWQTMERRDAIEKRARDRDFQVIPVLLPGAERPRRGDVPHLDFLINAAWIEFVNSLDDERPLRRLIGRITGTRPPEPEKPSDEGVCPYRGLEAFRPDDAKFFFGRKDLTGWLVSDLRRELQAAKGARFLGVLG